MAKKIKLDFSKTEERSGWNTRQIPEGIYKAEVSAVTETEAQDGTAMLVYAFTPTEAKYRTRRFPFYCKLQQNQLWKLRDLLVAAGQEVPKKALSIDPGKIVGSIIAIEVEDDSYNGQIRSQVQSTYDISLVEDESDYDKEGGFEPEDEAYDSDEEDEDEYEEDEPEAEEEDDEDDDLGDEDLDDEDDLDDDELYEDDEDEEEPEPAPKRRAPAKKAPAKAPAKRKVKRG